MNITNASIDSIKHDISKTSEALENLYTSLGCYCVENVGVLFYSPAESVFNQARILLDKKREIDGKISELRKALELLDNGGNEINRSQSNVKQISDKIDTLTESLGAVAYEIYNSGLLPASLSPALASMREFDEKSRHIMDQALNCGSKLKRTYFEKLLAHHKANITKNFYETGVALLASDSVTQLPGSRSGAILDQIEILTRQKQNVKQVISQKTSDLSNAENSLKNMGVLGGENRTLKELEQKKRKAEEELDSLYLSYGTVLSESMEQWLPGSSDAGINDYCRRIKTEKCRLRRQELNQDFLLVERDIDIINAQSAQLKTQLEHLIEEKRLVEEQIEDIESKICNNNDSVEVLINKEKELSRMAADINPGDLK